MGFPFFILRWFPPGIVNNASYRRAFVPGKQLKRGEYDEGDEIYGSYFPRCIAQSA